MATRVIAPAALVALKQALTDVYWYKSDLRSFLTATLSKPEILGRLNWDDYKRNIVSSLVDLLSRNEGAHQADLLRLMSEVARIEDFSHLARLEDGKTKSGQAKQSVAALRRFVGRTSDEEAEQEAIEQRRKAAYEAKIKTTGVRDKLEELTR